MKIHEYLQQQGELDTTGKIRKKPEEEYQSGRKTDHNIHSKKHYSKVGRWERPRRDKK